MSGLRRQAAALLRREEPRKLCIAARCHEVIVPGRVMCPNHWYFLPGWLRTAIQETFVNAEWDDHQEALRQAADFIDAAIADARAAGFAGVHSVRLADQSIARYLGKVFS